MSVRAVSRDADTRRNSWLLEPAWRWEGAPSGRPWTTCEWGSERNELAPVQSSFITRTPLLLSSPPTLLHFYIPQFHSPDGLDADFREWSVEQHLVCGKWCSFLETRVFWSLLLTKSQQSKGSSCKLTYLNEQFNTNSAYGHVGLIFDKFNVKWLPLICQLVPNRKLHSWCR